MNISSITRMHHELLRSRPGRSAWGNRPEGAPYVEPTALAALALAASDPNQDADRSRAAVCEAGDWLAGLQQRSGALGIAPDLAQPCWTTPWGILVWSAADRPGDAQKRAVDWLLAQQGETANPAAGDPFGHDPRIPGWSWVAGTSSWLEPTAMAVLALRRAGQSSHRRTREGERLIRDRVIRSGGWNYGNSTVFGADLRPHPAPTGLALLALAGVDESDEPLVERSCDYLETILPTTRAPQSLCFGLLALAAWGRRPELADDWLEAAQGGAARSSNSVAQLAYVLLAAGPRALELFGLSEPVGEGRIIQ
jgi:hypothetical protein